MPDYTQSVTTTEPWKVAQPYIEQGFQQAQTALNTPLQYFQGQQIADLSPTMTQAQTAIQNQYNSTGMSDTINQAIQGLLSPTTVAGATNVQGIQTQGPTSVQGINVAGPQSFGAVSVAGPSSVGPINLQGPQIAQAEKEKINFQGQDMLNKIMSGGLLDPNSNAYLQKSVESAITPIRQEYLNTIVPGINSGLATMGRYGSDAMTNLQGKAESDYLGRIADTSNTMYSKAYDTNLASLMQGLGTGADLATSQASINADVSKTNATLAQQAYSEAARLQAEGKIAEAQMQFQAAESYAKRSADAAMMAQQLSATSGENFANRLLQSGLQQQQLGFTGQETAANRALQAALQGQQLNFTGQENFANRGLQAQQLNQSGLMNSVNAANILNTAQNQNINNLFQSGLIDTQRSQAIIDAEKAEFDFQQQEPLTRLQTILPMFNGYGGTTTSLLS